MNEMSVYMFERKKNKCAALSTFTEFIQYEKKYLLFDANSNAFFKLQKEVTSKC